MACTTNQLHVTKIEQHSSFLHFALRRAETPHDFSTESWSNKMMRYLTKAAVFWSNLFCASYAFNRVNIQLAQEILAVKATLRHISSNKAERGSKMIKIEVWPDPATICVKGSSFFWVVSNQSYTVVTFRSCRWLLVMDFSFLFETTLQRFWPKFLKNVSCFVSSLDQFPALDVRRSSYTTHSQDLVPWRERTLYVTKPFFHL